jgi:hypothetical protein
MLAQHCRGCPCALIMLHAGNFQLEAVACRPGRLRRMLMRDMARCKIPYSHLVASSSLTSRHRVFAQPAHGRSHDCRNILSALKEVLFHAQDSPARPSLRNMDSDISTRLVSLLRMLKHDGLCTAHICYSLETLLLFKVGGHHGSKFAVADSLPGLPELLCTGFIPVRCCSHPGCCK